MIIHISNRHAGGPRGKGRDIARVAVAARTHPERRYVFVGAKRQGGGAPGRGQAAAGIAMLRGLGGRYDRQVGAWWAPRDRLSLGMARELGLRGRDAQRRWGGGRVGKSVGRGRGGAKAGQAYVTRSGRWRERADEVLQDSDGPISLGTVGATAAVRQAVWDSREAMERPGGRVQRLVTGELPHELLGRPQLLRAVTGEIGEALFGRYGLPWHAAIHRPDAAGDPRNVHLHVVGSDRPLLTRPTAMGHREGAALVAAAWSGARSLDDVVAALAAGGAGLAVVARTAGDRLAVVGLRDETAAAGDHQPEDRVTAAAIPVRRLLALASPVLAADNKGGSTGLGSTGLGSTGRDRRRPDLPSDAAILARWPHHPDGSGWRGPRLAVRGLGYRWGTKVREADGPAYVRAVRAAWAAACNRGLERAEADQLLRRSAAAPEPAPGPSPEPAPEPTAVIGRRYSGRSWRRLGIAKEPGRHLGTYRMRLERAGVATGLGLWNRLADERWQRRQQADALARLALAGPRQFGALAQALGPAADENADLARLASQSDLLSQEVIRLALLERRLGGLGIDPVGRGDVDDLIGRPTRRRAFLDRVLMGDEELSPRERAVATSAREKLLAERRAAVAAIDAGQTEWSSARAPAVAEYRQAVADVRQAADAVNESAARLRDQLQIARLTAVTEIWREVDSALSRLPRSGRKRGQSDVQASGDRAPTSSPVVNRAGETRQYDALAQGAGNRIPVVPLTVDALPKDALPKDAMAVRRAWPLLPVGPLLAVGPSSPPNDPSGDRSGDRAGDPLGGGSWRGLRAAVRLQRAEARADAERQRRAVAACQDGDEIALTQLSRALARRAADLAQSLAVLPPAGIDRAWLAHLVTADRDARAPSRSPPRPPQPGRRGPSRGDERA